VFQPAVGFSTMRGKCPSALPHLSLFRPFAKFSSFAGFWDWRESSAAPQPYGPPLFDVLYNKLKLIHVQLFPTDRRTCASFAA